MCKRLTNRGVNFTGQYWPNCESVGSGTVISRKLVNESNDRIFLIFSRENRAARFVGLKHSLGASGVREYDQLVLVIGSTLAQCVLLLSTRDVEKTVEKSEARICFRRGKWGIRREYRLEIWRKNADDVKMKGKREAKRLYWDFSKLLAYMEERKRMRAVTDHTFDLKIWCGVSLWERSIVVAL